MKGSLVIKNATQASWCTLNTHMACIKIFFIRRQLHFLGKRGRGDAANTSTRGPGGGRGRGRERGRGGRGRGRGAAKVAANTSRSIMDCK